MTLSDIATLYVSVHVLSQQYAQQLIRTARRFRSAVGDLRVEEIDAERIAVFLHRLHDFTSNRHTIANHLAHVAILLRFAKESGYLSRIPLLPRIARPKKVPRAWTFEQFKHLYETANRMEGRVGVQLARIWWPSLIAATYHTASRIGALLAVRWSDLDLSRRLLVLRAETTKTKREQMFILPEYVVAKIAAMRWPRRDLIWQWPHSRRYFFRRFRMILRAARLEPGPGVRFGLFHQIRRTAATVAAMRHGLHAAQILLGHTSARTTIEHYVDPTFLEGSVELPSLE